MDEKIKLTTQTLYSVCADEMKRMYTTGALYQYKYKRTPEYQEATLHRMLCRDLQKFNEEMTKVCERDPNNLTLHQLKVTIERHYGYLKRIVKSEEVSEDIIYK